MPVSKRQSTQLSQARAAHQENLKKRRVDQQIVKDNSYDTIDDEANSGWYWHDSSDDDYSDSDKESAGEGEEEEEERTQSGSQFPTAEPAVLGWDGEGEAKLRGIWGKGSQSMEERKQRNAREFQKQAAQCYHIGGMFKKAQEKADQRRKTQVQATDGQHNNQEKSDLNNTAQPACSLPASQKEVLIELRIQALKNLERLMDLVTEQEKKYSSRLSPQSNYYQRHLMVNIFYQVSKRSLEVKHVEILRYLLHPPLIEVKQLREILYVGKNHGLLTMKFLVINKPKIMSRG